MLAYVWRTMAWFVAGTAVALGFLLVPLEVAAQRKQLDRTATQIAAAERDIRALQTEFDTRSNYAQVEQWNGQHLGLSAPVAEQFVGSESALAQVDVQDADAAAHVQVASFIPSGPPPPALAAVTRVIPPAAIAAEQTRPARTAQTARVAVRSAPAEHPAAVPQLAALRPAPTERPRLQAVAMLDRSLLSAATLRDLSAGARSETDRRR